MKLEWMGEYRPFILSLFRFGNAYAMISKKDPQEHGKITFSAEQIQTVEYILENEDKNLNMAEYAQRLGTTPSSFSKNIKKLMEKGLVEKYHVKGNKKNVVIRVTPLGYKVYEEYSETAFVRFVGKLYEVLNDIPTEYIDKFTEVLNTAALSIKQESEPTLEKIE